MKMEPKGRMPPSATMTHGSMNHFFSGMGRGTALTRQGWSAAPARLRPSTLPTRLRGRMTNKQMEVTATIVPKGMALGGEWVWNGRKLTSNFHQWSVGQSVVTGLLTVSWQHLDA